MPILPNIGIYGAEHMSLLGTPLSIQIYRNSKGNSSKNKDTLWFGRITSSRSAWMPLKAWSNYLWIMLDFIARCGNIVLLSFFLFKRFCPTKRLLKDNNHFIHILFIFCVLHFSTLLQSLAKTIMGLFANISILSRNICLTFELQRKNRLIYVKRNYHIWMLYPCISKYYICK